MNIETTKLELMQLLLQTKKESILEKIKAIFEQESSSFYSTTTSELKQRAEASLKAIEKGETRSINAFKKELDHWKNQQSI
ncbi:hypothetical protein [uncultured Lacinutrix sp.]|uniref:hypothetical protein n=1 Tax=uncultured Lacinutrix sp. TaxID=574032 RepID=UPI0026174191|nr:hypothetical protein [uncultured Lacinutrix sp.]